MALDGYSLNLSVGSVSSATQVAAIENGLVNMPELIRCAVDGLGLTGGITSGNSGDAFLIQEFIGIGTAFPVGSSFKRLVLTVESLSNPLTTTANMIGDNSYFNTASLSPVGYKVNVIDIWRPENIIIQDLRRYIPVTITEISSADLTAVIPTGGSNTTLVPGNLLIGGNVFGTNGLPYAFDLEVSTIVINLSAGSTQGLVDVFNNYVRGVLKFSDGTYVETGALESNQVFISAAIQSITKDFAPGTYGDGYDFNDGYFTANETISILYTQSSGLLRIRAANIQNYASVPELSTKIVLTVYLKKAGFKNKEQNIDATTLSSLAVSLDLITENDMLTTSTSVTTSLPISSIIGVFLATDVHQTGTNYYTVGVSSFSGYVVQDLAAGLTGSTYVTVVYYAT